MSDITNKFGFKPELRTEMLLRDKAMSGDLLLAVTPATLGSSATVVNAAIGGAAAKYTRDVVVELQSAAGDVHAWFDGTFVVSGAKTSTSGLIAFTGAVTDVTLVNGRGTVTLEYTGTWASGDTASVTVTGGTKLGYTIANASSIDTLIA